MSYEQRVLDLGIVLPKPPKAGANYASFARTDSLVFIAGQAPFVNGELACVGKVGSEVSFEHAKQAARICALNMVAVLKQACDGNLDRVQRFLKLGSFVYSDDEFTLHHRVTDGATDLLVDIFGERGLPARFAVGMAVMPLRMTVEIDAIVEIRPAP
jgi:enamine deaminase RidA (YjgF/YER057c/UK114 family)